MTKQQLEGVLRHVLGIASGVVGGAWVAQYFTPEIIDAVVGLFGAIGATWLSVRAKKTPE